MALIRSIPALRLSRARPSQVPVSSVFLVKVVSQHRLRTNSTSAQSTSDEAPFTGWSVRSPKDLYNHLSQYIVGQERAKRILSVAVFNHYHRIAPRLPPREPPPPPSPLPASSASSSRPLPPPIALDPPIPAPYNRNSSPLGWDRHSSSSSGGLGTGSGSRRADSFGPSNPGLDSPITWDPSRAGSQLDETRDATKFIGADEADPTLTHDLLTSRSREGQWARDGYFSARPPPLLPSLLGQALKRRKSSVTSSSSYETGTGTVSDSSLSNSQSTTDQYRAQTQFPSQARPQSQTQGVKQRRKRVEIEIEPEQKPPILDDEPLLQSNEEVIIEKSNVLMIGPTGTGKTLMARTLAKILDVPFATCDATSYTQAGYVGEDVENCVLRLLQNAEYDVNRAEVGIIHIDEIDKLARRGGGDSGSWGGSRDVGGEGVQQALLRLLEGTTLTLQAKPPPISSNINNNSNSPNTSSFPTVPGSTSGGSSLGPKALSEPASGSNIGGFGDPPGWDPNNPMNRSLGGKKSIREGLPGFSFSSGGGNPSAKGETFVVDTTNVLFVLSGAFVGLDSIVNRRLGKGSIGFGAPLPKTTSSSSPSSNPAPLTGLSTPDLTTYGLIPEFLGRLPVLSVLHPLSIEDMVRILVEPRNALIKQYMAMFERYGSQLRFTDRAIREIAREGLERGGGARGLRGVMEEVLVDAMFEVPGSSVRYCLITERAVKKLDPAVYFSRGQKILFYQAVEDEDGLPTSSSTFASPAPRSGGSTSSSDEGEEPPRISATG